MKISENKGEYFRLLSSIYHYLLEPENSCKYSCILYTRAMSGHNDNHTIVISRHTITSKI